MFIPLCCLHTQKKINSPNIISDDIIVSSFYLIALFLYYILFYLSQSTSSSPALSKFSYTVRLFCDCFCCCPSFFNEPRFSYESITFLLYFVHSLPFPCMWFFLPHNDKYELDVSFDKSISFQRILLFSPSFGLLVCEMNQRRNKKKSEGKTKRDGKRMEWMKTEHHIDW